MLVLLEFCSSLGRGFIVRWVRFIKELYRNILV